MAALKVFVSSTCYDLSVVRAELREFLVNLGHEPIMSEYNDILFDPRNHTHESCISEIKNADVIVLIIGTRFGGKGIPPVLDAIDFEALKSKSKDKDFLNEPNKISITQLEILKAIELNVPVYAFIDSKVMSDHHIYERNKDKPFINEIDFPSIEKKDTAIYIFKFINFLRLRQHNNSIFEFSKISDIQITLRRQWSAQLQRLLQEHRQRSFDIKQGDKFLESLQEVKSLILSTINTESGKEIGKGVLDYRSLISFLIATKADGLKTIILSDKSWNEILDMLRIEKISDFEGFSGRTEEALIKSDNTFYINRTLPTYMLESKWDKFRKLKKEIKESIFDSISESDQHFLLPLRYYNRPFDEYLKTLSEKKSEKENIAQQE